MSPGSVVIIHLLNPSEKYWGVLEAILPPGVTVRGVNLSSFEDWLRALTSEEVPSIGPATVFFPLHRVERIFLDEPLGGVESLRQSFERRVGGSLEDYFGDPSDA